MTASASDNPLLETWTTPYGMPPFDRIRPEHFGPAFATAIARHKQEIAAIAGNAEAPTFENSVAAMERSGQLIQQVATVFFGLSSADTNDALQQIERDIAPILARHQSEIYLDGTLFARITAVWEKRDALPLDAEQKRVLDRYHTIFHRSGAGLGEAAKKRMAEINERLATVGTLFSQNVLADEKSWSLTLESEADLAGLPEFVRSAAARAAADRGLPGKHVITLSRSSIEPFLVFSTRRDLREKAFDAWIRRGEMGGDTDNRALIAETIKLRAERARLLGYANFADMRLADAMAKTPQAVRALLERVWEPARARAARERDALQKLVVAEGGNFRISAADWRHYAERERKRAFDFDEAELKPYLQLDKMIEAAFYTAGRLFGLSFAEIHDVPVYNPDVRVWKATGADGRFVGLFMGDYFARASKRSGAWMSGYREQQKLVADIRPIVVNVMNFAKPPEDKPALLSFDDARTLFHEFGHGLHGLLSDVTYPLLSGTSVATDFVELPSQLFEHWLEQPEVLRKFAIHAETGAADAGSPARAGPRVAHLQPGFRDGGIHLLGPGRSRPARESLERGCRCRRLRKGDTGADRHAGCDRDAPPHAALPAYLLRRSLRVGLLQLSVVGGARRGRVRRLRGDRRRVRSGDGQAPSRLCLFGGKSPRPGCRLSGLPRPRPRSGGALEEARARSGGVITGCLDRAPTRYKLQGEGAKTDLEVK